MNLRAEREALLARSDLTGAALREGLTELTDRWLAELLGDEPGVGLVAVGGYGRREPAPGSDLDLLLLHRGRPGVSELADRLWYPIWDTGVGLDHSVRTVAETVAVAREDLKVALGVLDVRHVAGDPSFAAELADAVRAAWRGEARRRLAELTAARAEREARFGELAFLLEPDLKESLGGLRDVHAIWAVAAAWVADPPGAEVRAAHELLLDVRGELHRRTGRGSDRLVLQEQSAVATALGYQDDDALMTAVYQAGRTITYAIDVTWRRVHDAIRPPAARRPWRRGVPVPPPRRPLADGVVEQDGEVVLARDVAPGLDATLPLRVAAAAAQAGLPVGPHTLGRLAAETTPLPVPWPPAARDAFISLLGAGPPTVAVLEALDQVGLLGRLLPEWERVRCRPQRNAYHRFTVDRHLIETAARAAALTREVTRPDLLLVGALLHDIGKGYPGDHTDAGIPVAAGVARRLGLAPADVETVKTMVRHHLLLPDTATRRDLDDAETIRLVADAVGDRETLALLHALAIADGQATGPAAWGDWKAGLVSDLVGRVHRLLATEEVVPVPPMDRLSPGARELAEHGEFAVDVEPVADGHRVTVVVPDRPGLLWRSAGVLALQRLDVRAATATSVGSTAVTTFDVTPRFGAPPDWDLVRAEMRSAFEDALPLGEKLAERERAYHTDPPFPVAPRVVYVDDASRAATVLEVRAHDTVGLLYRIARALAEAGLDVRSARISTLGAEAVDAFYVVDSDGLPLADDDRRSEVADAVLAAISR